MPLTFKRKFYRVPYCVPAWGWAEHKAILRCLLTGSLVEGKDKGEVLRLVGERTGRSYVFGFNSGREAIYAALKAAGIGAGDKVIMPSYCCGSVAQAIKKTGAEPAFCEVLEDFSPDVSHITGLIDESVKAIVFPHLFGYPGRIDELEARLQVMGWRERILLIDDAAQSFGAELNHRPLGSFGDCGVVSFGPGKTVTASGGGLLLTDKPDLADRIRRLQVQPGDKKDKLRALFYWLLFRRWRRWTRPFYPYVRRVFVSAAPAAEWPQTLFNIDAALARPQLQRLEKLIALRRERGNRMEKAAQRFNRDPELKPAFPGTSLEAADDRQGVFTKYIMVGQHSPEIKGRLQQRYHALMEAAGVEIFPLYNPLHLETDSGRKPPRLPRTESLEASVYQAPLEPSISEKHFRRVTGALQKFFVEAPSILNSLSPAQDQSRQAEQPTRNA